MTGKLTTPNTFERYISTTVTRNRALHSLSSRFVICITYTLHVTDYYVSMLFVSINSLDSVRRIQGRRGVSTLSVFGREHHQPYYALETLKLAYTLQVLLELNYCNSPHAIDSRQFFHTY